MQNIKKFTRYTPSPEVIQSDFEATGKVYAYLISEDGLDWYECQRLFSDATIKLMYDDSGVINSVVSEPVPERDNSHAVSMFFPLNMSVAEINAPLPGGFELESGTWIFDGATVFQSPELLTKFTLRESTAQFNRLLIAASAAAFPLQSAVTLGIATPEDQSALAALQQYAIDLANTDLTQNPVAFPATPASVKLPL